MRKRIVALVGCVGLLLLCASPLVAGDCESCRFTLICNGTDCELVTYCGTPGGARTGAVSCWVNMFGCFTSSEYCLLV